MTVTDTGRRTREQILAAAREEVGDGPLPSKTALSKTLRTHYNTASEIYDVLSEERRRAAAERSRERRRALAAVAKRKGQGRVTVLRPRPFTTPDQPLLPAPAVETVEVIAEQVPVAVPEPVVQALPVPAVAPSEAVKKTVATWPIFLLALPAFVAIWSGWVDLGRLTGFGVVHPFPGIPGLDGVRLDTAITLPVGLETYAAYALYVWLSGQVPARARRFARWSAIGSLVLGAAGQVAYHLMIASGMTRAPWQITTVVACLPVAVLGMGAALRHLVHTDLEGAK